jgi:hypothetical protein
VAGKVTRVVTEPVIAMPTAEEDLEAAFFNAFKSRA